MSSKQLRNGALYLPPCTLIGFQDYRYWQTWFDLVELGDRHETWSLGMKDACVWFEQQETTSTSFVTQAATSSESIGDLFLRVLASIRVSTTLDRRLRRMKLLSVRPQDKKHAII